MKRYSQTEKLSYLKPLFWLLLVTGKANWPALLPLLQSRAQNSNLSYRSVLNFDFIISRGWVIGLTLARRLVYNETEEENQKVQSSKRREFQRVVGSLRGAWEEPLGWSQFAVSALVKSKSQSAMS
jgi:hypothetical protein